MSELYELFAKNDNSISEKSFKETQSGNFVFEAFLGDKMKAYVTKKLNDGFEFGGYGNGGITLSWWTPAPRKEMITEINPSFLDQKIADLLNEETKKLITKAKREILEKKLQRDMKPVYEGLLQQKLLFSTFTFERFIKSDFAQDLRDVIKVNYDSQSAAYTWEIAPEGVRFTPSEAVQKKGFEVIELKMEDYDSNLNYKKSVFEFLGNGDNDAQKMIDEDNKISQDQWYNEALKEYEDNIDMVSVENPALKALHDVIIKPLMYKIKDEIEKGLHARIPKPQIQTKIKNLVEESEIIPKLNSISSMDKTAKEAINAYKDKLETWGNTLFAKYDLKTHHDDDHDNHDGHGQPE